MTYCTVLFTLDEVFPKNLAAFTASAARSLCVGMFGTDVPSLHTPASGDELGWVTNWAPDTLEQVVVPVATFWQYCVVEVLQRSDAPYRPFRKLVRYGLTAYGSDVHPQKTT